MTAGAAPGAGETGSQRAPGRHEFVLALALAAGGAGLVLLGAHQDWATVAAAAQSPLPSAPVAVSGQAIVPLAGALALASLAGTVAVIATSGLARRVVGLLLAAFGLAIAVSVALHIGPAAVRAAADTAGVSQAGSTTAGTSQGASQGGLPTGALTLGDGPVTMAGAAWRSLAVAGGLVIAAGGLLTAGRGRRWPGMSSRYSRVVPEGSAAPGAGGSASPAAGPARAGPVADSATLWESLNQGVDPTVPGANADIAGQK